MGRVPNVDLQNQFMQAVDVLRKDHPQLNTHLPIAYLKTHDILRDRFTVNYFKGLWLVWMLVSIDPSIIKDKKSADLREFARFCAEHVRIVR